MKRKSRYGRDYNSEDQEQEYSQRYGQQRYGQQRSPQSDRNRGGDWRQSERRFYSYQAHPEDPNYRGERTSYQYANSDHEGHYRQPSYYYGYGNSDYGEPGFTARGYEKSYDSSRINTGRGPKGYKRSDERVRDDICERLSMRADIDASNIEVSVDEGEVTLSGTVDNRGLKRRIEDTTESVFGVKDINNKIKVQSSDESMSSDMTQNRSDANKGKERSKHSMH